MFYISDEQAVNRRLFRKLVVAVFFGCCAAGGANAQNAQGTPTPDHNHNHATTEARLKPDIPSKLVIPDSEVTNQDGKQLKFYTDLVKGKKVMVSFIFTSCRATCPLVGRNFQKLQEEIGAGLGKDIFLITVSTDPTVDTPDVMKKWGERFGRREGWTLVTGEEASVNKLLLALTGATRQREGEHNSLLLLFDDSNGGWDLTSSTIRPVLLLDGLKKVSQKPADR
jgi:protein SCO1